jgi:predicted amino acid-binding ACT domain protein
MDISAHSDDFGRADAIRGEQHESLVTVIGKDRAESSRRSRHSARNSVNELISANVLKEYFTMIMLVMPQLQPAFAELSALLMKRGKRRPVRAHTARRYFEAMHRNNGRLPK